MTETQLFLALIVISTCFSLCINYSFAETFQYECNLPKLPTSAEDPRLLAPWVASIFKLNADGIWKYHCGGTLTASYVVITTASCVLSNTTQNGMRYHTKYSHLRIVAGLLTSDYYAKRDEHTQESEVAQIREHKPPKNTKASGYLQVNINPANLAGILLVNEFNFTKYVQSVCLSDGKFSGSLNLGLKDRESEKGVVAGFNTNRFRYRRDNNNSVWLETFKMSYDSSDSCFRAYRYDENVICGLADFFSQHFPCFLEGAGLIIGSVLKGVYTSSLKTTQWNTHGYPSNTVNSLTSKCQDFDKAFVTSHGNYYRWAILQSFCGAGMLQCQDGDCFHPDQLCDGIAQCQDKTDESEEICLNYKDCTDDHFTCTYGACVDKYKVCDGNMDCADNSDEVDEKLCQEIDANRNTTCSPIPEKKGVDTRCSLPERLGGFPIDDCKDRALPVGTTAYQSCSRYYRGEAKSSFECQRNGNWSNTDFLNCSPDCGISEPSKTAFVVGGQNVQSRGEWPWHAAIYFLKNGTKELHCGGSLISTNVILTAAHCVTEHGTADILNVTQVRIVLGKLFSEYEKDEKKFTQEIQIKKLIVEECFNPNTYESDIALIILKSNVKITGSVRPVCFSDDEELAKEQFKKTRENGTFELGTTVGFGLDETKNISVDLKILKMPVIPKAACEAVFPKSQREIRYTWICGGYTNGSAVCPGDSGGGFVFPKIDSYSRSRRYYVQGVVSHGPKAKHKNDDPCSKNFYKVFTKVAPFAKWIQKIVEEANRESKIDSI